MKIQYCDMQALYREIKGKKVIVFGISSSFINEFISAGVDIDFCVDNNALIQNTYINKGESKYRILAPEVFNTCSFDSEHILIIFSKSYKEIINQCNQYESLGNLKCYIFSLITGMERNKHDKSSSLNYRLKRPVERMYIEMGKTYHDTDMVKIRTKIETSIRDLDERKVIIPKINFLVTTCCTLKCKDCIGQIPFIKASHGDKERIIHDITNFFSGIDKCIVVEIGGGEPFLYPYIDEVLDYLINEEKVEYVRIPTNGTIIPSTKVTQLLKNRKVSLYISYYEMDKYTNNFLEFVNSNNIIYYFDKNMVWIDAGHIKKRNKSEDQKMIEYYICNAGKMCKTVYEGRLYHCARLARIHDYIERNDDDSISIDDFEDKNNFRINILDFFLKNLCEGCDYCDLAHVEAPVIVAGKQIKNQR